MYLNSSKHKYLCNLITVTKYLTSYKKKKFTFFVLHLYSIMFFFY